MKTERVYYYDIVRVRRNDGRITTVSFPPELALRMTRVFGSRKLFARAVRRAVRAVDNQQLTTSLSAAARQELQRMIAAV